MVSFALSYDQMKWSAESLRFTFVEDDEFGDWMMFAVGLLGIAAFAGLGVFCYCKCGGAGGSDKFPPSKSKGDAKGVALLDNEDDSADGERQPFLKKRYHAD
jgi:hypothetical protein